MGNSLISPCLHPGSKDGRAVKLVFWGGATSLLNPGFRLTAGDVIFQLPDYAVCHADSFFIGRRVPSLSVSDELLLGETYFVLPSDRFSGGDTLSAATLSLLSSHKGRKGGVLAIGGGGQLPILEYVKGADGKTAIKVLPEYIMRLISVDVGSGRKREGGMGEEICSTPELRKHYEQLVGARNRTSWSPKLETITERAGNSKKKRSKELGKVRSTNSMKIGFSKMQINHLPKVQKRSTSFATQRCNLN